MNPTPAEEHENADHFQILLRARIADYFQRNRISRYANGLMVFKVCACLFLWLITIAVIYLAKGSFATLCLLYCAHGIASLLVIFNVGHDAVHQAISTHSWVNGLLGYSFNLVGSNRYSWFLKHNVGHHRHTNVKDKDIDIETTPLFRVSPFSHWRSYYRYQHQYIFFVYCLLSLFLIAIVDFRVLYNQVNVKPREWLVCILTKLMYLAYSIVVPVLILPFTLPQVLLAFFLMHCVVGLVISLVLLPSHFVSYAEYYPSADDVPATWTEHQLKTTVDIAPGSNVANFLLGGLNTNVAHHIFPGICHVHLVGVTAIVRATAAEQQLPYQSYSPIQALREHLLFLKRMGSLQTSKR